MPSSIRVPFYQVGWDRKWTHCNWRQSISDEWASVDGSDHKEYQPLCLQHAGRTELHPEAETRNIPIIFEKESVNTLEASGELMVTILASIAQQESASISQNVRMGINFGFQEGRDRVNFSSFLGYRRGDKPGTYEIVPAEADGVRRIYRQFFEGYSPNMIADGLMEDGICTPSGGEKWYPSTVASILENEKYAGDLLMQKWYVEDCLTHKCVKNTGDRPQYFVEDDHECCT